MMCKTHGSYFYNIDALPSDIVSIKFVTTDSASGSAVYYANVFESATNGAITSEFTLTGKGEFTVTADTAGLRYFNITLDGANGKNGQIAKIIIELAPAE